MKTILCYGDSNTYGYNPMDGMRYPSDIRWTGQLQEILGEKYRVIEEGCNGRTTVFDDPVEGWKNGLDYLKPCLNSHKPVDIVVLMLGTNDLKEVFHASPEEIAAGAEKLVQTIFTFTEEKQGYMPQIILISPPEIGSEIESSVFNCSFRKHAVAKSRELSVYYEGVAERNGCAFLDAAKHVAPSKEDRVHLTAEAHSILAQKLGEMIK